MELGRRTRSCSSGQAKVCSFEGKGKNERFEENEKLHHEKEESDKVLGLR